MIINLYYFSGDESERFYTSLKTKSFKNEQELNASIDCATKTTMQSYLSCDRFHCLHYKPQTSNCRTYDRRWSIRLLNNTTEAQNLQLSAFLIFSFYRASESDFQSKISTFLYSILSTKETLRLPRYSSS